MASASSSCVAGRPSAGSSFRAAARPVPALVDVRRHPDRARLAGHRALDRLADPPGGVRRELEALAVVKLLDGPVEADNAVLDQVAERDATTAIALRDRDHEPEIRVDHPLLRRFVAALDRLRQGDLLGSERVAPDLVEEEIEGAGRGGRSTASSSPRSKSSSTAGAPSVDEIPLLVLEQRLHFRVIQDGLDG